MSSPPTVPDEAIARLVDEGFDMVFEAGHLVIQNVPFRSRDGLHHDGRLVLPAGFDGSSVIDESGDHRIWFAGVEPVDSHDQPLGIHQPHGYADDQSADFMLSFKPSSGMYPTLYEKVSHYTHILMAPARELDPDVTATRGGAFEAVPSDLPFVYADTNTTRAGLIRYSNKFRGHTVAIIGLGGTGSYLLDQVAKTWVDRIILIDGDQLERHNAFRAPGAASYDTVLAKPNKAEYFANEYSRMHTGITAHPVALDTNNLHLLEDATFVFLAAADADARPQIMAWLVEQGVPFIDVGMSFREGEGGLTGMTRIDTYRSGTTATLPEQAATPAGADDYSSNIQVAELNAINATLAIIEWKRQLGIYATHTASTRIVYKLFGNEISNGDLP